jgi:NAD(P)-dependent dehydrogenase (short-subunit alcohol dehydrogenase family)
MARARLAELGLERGEAFEATVDRERRALPLGRFVEPEEVGRLVAFLCSPDAAAITGQALSICGGATLFAG